VRTRVGYAGGTTKNPTYHDLGDHTETVEIDFDPAVITYSQLLDLFWESHNPCERPWSRQYMTAVFANDETQRKLAEASRDRVAKKIPGKIETKILPATPFTLAEDYHQKYYLRQYADLSRELHAIYPDEAAFTRSTAAARINGYLGRHATREQIEGTLPLLGLSSAAAKTLLDAASD
jgi:peptide-methionine (S)-S-oxide reductase